MDHKYLVVGRYKNNPYEVIDGADSHPDAMYLMKEYKLAYGNEWTLDVRYNTGFVLS